MPTKAKTVVKTAAGISKPLVVLLVLIVVGGAFFVLNSGNSANAQFPTFSQVNNSVPSAFASIKSSSGSAATANLARLTQSQLSNISQLTILYSGIMSLQESLISINSPLYVSDSKYGSDQKLLVNVTNVEAVGPVDITYVNMTKGIFTCTNLNAGALQNGDYQAVLFGNHSVTCRQTGHLVGLDLGELANFNLSQLTGNGVMLHYNAVYQSRYNGVPCTYMSGTISDPAVNNAGGIFQMCMSDTYYVPLSLSILLSANQKSFSVTINETSITTSSSKSSIDSLPGPVV